MPLSFFFFSFYILHLLFIPAISCTLFFSTEHETKGNTAAQAFPALSGVIFYIFLYDLHMPPIDKS